MYALSHDAVDADRRVAQGPGSYWGGVLVASAAGYATVDVYDGDNTSGELIDSYVVGSLLAERHSLPGGVHFERGLYVDLGSNVSKFTISYHVYPSNPSDRSSPESSNPDRGPMGPRGYS